MAKQASLFLHRGANSTAVTFTAADTTATKTLFTAGSEDSDLKSLVITSSDTATINFQLFYYDGSTAFLIGTVRAVTLVGTDGAVNSIDMLNSTALPFLPVDDAGKRYIPVKTGHSIKGGCKATMTANTATITAVGYDY